MPEWALVIVLILGVSILVGVWLIVRAVKSGQRIEEFSRRLQLLNPSRKLSLRPSRKLKNLRELRFCSGGGKAIEKMAHRP